METKEEADFTLTVMFRLPSSGSSSPNHKRGLGTGTWVGGGGVGGLAGGQKGKRH